MGVAETLLKENSNRTEILARILPNMASAADARMLVAKLLNNNKIEVQKLRREVGFALKPMLGDHICTCLCVGMWLYIPFSFVMWRLGISRNQLSAANFLLTPLLTFFVLICFSYLTTGVMDGHYSLDLSNKMDKFCLNKLLEVGMTIAFRRANKR